MNTPRKPASRQNDTPSAPAARGAAKRARSDLQPPATGASEGSPAAPVMKQFAKTKAESSGRS